MTQGLKSDQFIVQEPTTNKDLLTPGFKSKQFMTEETTTKDLITPDFNIEGETLNKDEKL